MRTTGVRVAGPKEKLNSTVISQPAIYVASIAALEKLRQEKGDVSVLFGSYSAGRRPLYQCLLKSSRLTFAHLARHNMIYARQINQP